MSTVSYDPDYYYFLQQSQVVCTTTVFVENVIFQYFLLFFPALWGHFCLFCSSPLQILCAPLCPASVTKFTTRKITARLQMKTRKRITRYKIHL